MMLSAILCLLNMLISVGNFPGVNWFRQASNYISITSKSATGINESLFINDLHKNGEPLKSSEKLNDDIIYEERYDVETIGYLEEN